MKNISGQNSCSSSHDTPTAHGPGVLEEIIHNLDYCDLLVIGEDLQTEVESLQLPPGTLLGKHLDATNSTSGISIYGKCRHTLPPHDNM